MAKQGRDEHRMVFDIRGRRRHVVKVVYAVLAVLMGASLFLVVGPVNIGSLLGSESSSVNPAQPYEEQAQRLERELKKDPEEPELLAKLTRAQANAGNLSVEETSSGERAYTIESIQFWRKASETWSKYLEATKEPAYNVAQLMATTLFTLAANGSRNAGEASSNINGAAEAQKLVAEQRPTVNSLSTAAFYTYFTFDYAAANELGEEAQKLANTKFERESIENKMKETEKRAREFEKQVKAAEKEAKEGGSGSAESLKGGALGGALGSGALGE
jgi:hypothetical protein